MKKKELIRLNEEFFERTEHLKVLIEDLKRENEELQQQIETLTQENETLSTNQAATEPLKALEEKLRNRAALSPDMTYGADIIGKIVVLAARSCNTLTSQEDNLDVKELINLILGKTEVLKAEILKAVELDTEFDSKKELIDAKQKEAEEYFASVMAQKS